jgi:transposase
VSTPSEPTLPPHSEALLAEINAQLKQQLDTTTKELEYARLKIQLLEERLRLQRIKKYGPGQREAK